LQVDPKEPLAKLIFPDEIKLNPSRDVARTTFFAVCMSSQPAIQVENTKLDELCKPVTNPAKICEGQPLQRPAPAQRRVARYAAT
jgi:hypothetical protein